MSYASDGKVGEDGAIVSHEIMTEKQGYEAMLYMLKAYYDATGSTDMTDILSGGGYYLEPDKPTDLAYWDYWCEAVEKVKAEGPPVW